MKKVIDVSHYQDPASIDYVAARARGVEAAILKISDGAHGSDHRAAEHARRASAAGMLIGGYHFMQPLDDGTVQAENFVACLHSVARACGHSEIFDLFSVQCPLWIDVENRPEWPQVNKWTRIARLCHLIATAERMLGEHMLGIYTGAPFWNTMFSGAEAISKSLGTDLAVRPLWISAYHNPAIPPHLPETWADWLMWQYTDAGECGCDTSLAKW